MTEGIEQVRSLFASAVRAAIDAYAKSGHMLDAALAYAKHGIPVFPLSVHSKAPVPKADLDQRGNKIPKSGGFYKATTESVIIHRWWDRKEYLIGMPTGPASGVFAVDVDTDEDHDANGLAAWQTLLAEHGEIDTRTHCTATFGLHVLFIYPDDHPIGCSSASMPKGIEIKGRGGYIVMPPSRRKGRPYTVDNDVDPIRAPDWLLDLITTRPASPLQVKARNAKGGSALAGVRATENKPRNSHFACDDIPADLRELASAVAAIPNDDAGWNEWTETALAIYAATKGQGFTIFKAWSATSSKNDPVKTSERWQEIDGSPPDRFGSRGRTIYRRAKENGWLPKTIPTYPQHHSAISRPHAQEVQRIAGEFLKIDEQEPAFWERWLQAAGIEPTPPVWAMRVDPGVGKTHIVVAEIARSGKRAVYAVPTHKLGSDIEEQFVEHGVAARVFRGRSADDPEYAGYKMCLNLDAVELALKCHADVAKTCCEYNGKRCRFFDQCGYQRQQMTPPQVWIVASDMVFHHQAAFGKPRALIIDQSFWQKALRGIDGGDDWWVPFASLTGNQGRRDLAAELQMQPTDGGLQRRVVEDMDAAALSQMIRVEWAMMPKLNLRPGMPEDEFDRLRKSSKVIDKIAHARRVIQILQELRQMLVHPEVEESGRLLIEERSGLRGIRWRGIDTISKQFQIPTLLLDATLPDLAVLQVLHPEAEIVADVRVALPPGVFIRQVLDAPTSSRKLIETSRLKDRDQHLNAVRRYIIRRWIETGRDPALVICQQKVEQWLKGKLPDAIAVAHYNAIAGLDVYKDVRLLILVGRAQPGPDAVETIAGMLSGSMPVTVATGQGFTWYPQVRRGIRLQDGSGVPVDGDHHPDPFAESVRQLITEAELVQALGRARAVNRTAQTPVDVDLLFDTVLPITVDEGSVWQEPSLLLETAAEGVVLLSPVDMVRVWPTIWPNEKAADRTLAKGIPRLPGFERVIYQLDGAKLKGRMGYFDRKLIPDPRAWIEARLGPLTDLSL